LLEYLYCDFCLAAPGTAAELKPLAEELGLTRLSEGAAAAVETRSADVEAKWVRSAQGQWIRVEDTLASSKGGDQSTTSTYIEDLERLVRVDSDQDQKDPSYLKLAIKDGDSGHGICRNVYAARTLLLSIEFFRGMLESGFSEGVSGKDTGTIIVRADDADALILCLRLLATGDWRLIPNSAREALNLVVEAHRLYLPEIVDAAEFALRCCVEGGDVDSNICQELPYIADLHGLPKLSNALQNMASGTASSGLTDDADKMGFSSSWCAVRSG
jgi:hypothetical protein